MNKNSSSLAEVLLSNGMLTAEQFKQIEREMARTHDSFQKVFKRLRFVSESDWTSSKMVFALKMISDDQGKQISRSILNCSKKELHWL